MLGLFQSSKFRCKGHYGKDAYDSVLNSRQNNPLSFTCWKKAKDSLTVIVTFLECH